MAVIASSASFFCMLVLLHHEVDHRSSPAFFLNRSYEGEGCEDFFDFFPTEVALEFVDHLLKGWRDGTTTDVLVDGIESTCKNIGAYSCEDFPHSIFDEG